MGDIYAEEMHVVMECPHIDLPNYTITQMDNEGHYTIIHTFEEEPYSPCLDENMIKNLNNMYAALYKKQDKLTAGDNITIDEFSKISAKIDTSQFAPMEHTHSKKDILHLGNLDNQYAAKTHKHTKSQITDLGDLDQEYAAKTHTHVKNDITDLGDLDQEYAAKNHSHAEYASKDDLPAFVNGVGMYNIITDYDDKSGIVTVKVEKDNLVFNIHYGSDVRAYETLIKKNNSEIFLINDESGTVSTQLDYTKYDDYVLVYVPITSISVPSDVFAVSLLVNDTTPMLEFHLEYVESALVEDTTRVFTIKGLIDFLYPIGSIYTSMNNKDPSEIFGGTWEPIEDRFMYCAPTTSASMQKDGSKTITVDNLPEHTHTFTGDEITGSVPFLPFSDQMMESIMYQDGEGALKSELTDDNWNMGPPLDIWEEPEFPSKKLIFKATPSGTIENTGKGTDYMPPYITIYAWYRTE